MNTLHSATAPAMMLTRLLRSAARRSEWRGRVEHAKREAEMARARVREPEVGLDRRGEDADDLPVDEIEDVDEEQKPQHAIAVCRGFPTLLRWRCSRLRRQGIRAITANCSRKSRIASRAAGSVSIGAWPTPGTTATSSDGAARCIRSAMSGVFTVGERAAHQQRRPAPGEPPEHQPGNPRRRLDVALSQSVWRWPDHSRRRAAIWPFAECSLGERLPIRILKIRKCGTPFVRRT